VIHVKSSGPASEFGIHGHEPSLAVLEAERRLIFVILISGGAIFSLIHSLMGAWVYSSSASSSPALLSMHDVGDSARALQFPQVPETGRAMKADTCKSAYPGAMYKVDDITKDWKEVSFASQVRACLKTCHRRRQSHIAPIYSSALERRPVEPINGRACLIPRYIALAEVAHEVIVSRGRLSADHRAKTICQL